MTATLEQQINDRMKDAMRAKDRRTSMLMRMIKSKVTELVTSKNYRGEEGDVLWQGVIEAYVKASRKTLTEYQALGESGAEHADQVEWEIETLSVYLPQLADADQTRQWVRDAIASLGEGAAVGRIMGEVMKAHKGEVDPGLTKQIAQEELA
jgi:uncharacterized protein YqeY